MIAPVNHDHIGGLIQLKFDQKVSNLDVLVNSVYFHVEEDDTIPSDTFTLDMNGVAPGMNIMLDITYVRINGTKATETIIVRKPQHDLGGMGATVIYDKSKKNITGVFFKFWLPGVKRVFVRGSFNGWRDVNRLDQLGNTGYWYGFSCDARPDDDYKFFVYCYDGAFDEVSDPAARKTIKTRHNSSDAQDANAVITDPLAFKWIHDSDYSLERRDLRRYIIYQLHWGTFLRTGAGLPYEKFIALPETALLADKRMNVQNKLKYIKDLGFSAIELLPVHEANGDRNAGYDPSFLFAIESTYGSPDDLRILVDEAHGLGLAVIFDSVINHLTSDLSHSSFSQKFIRGWYVRENAPWSNHNQWGGSDWGPDPDFDRYEIRNLLTDCMVMYAEEFHVDGIRFDATTTIPRYALKEMIERLKSNFFSNNTYLIAEHITDDPFPYTIGDIGFKGSWYKPAYYSAMDGILKLLGRGNLDALRKVIETNYSGEPITAVKYPLGSHDENWSNHGGKSPVTSLGGANNPYAQMKMRLGWSIASCSMGTPMMFMGVECLDGISWDNDSGYGNMDWHEAAGSISYNFKQMILSINKLRLSHAALRGSNADSKLTHWDCDNGVVAYKRWDQSGGVFLVVINISDNNWGAREYQVQSQMPGSTWHECFNSQYVYYGGWTGACNSDPSFHPKADSTGLLQGINLARWCLLILKLEN